MLSATTEVRGQTVEANTIYNEDCLETMQRMGENCCDLFTDPPYNVGKDYGEYTDDLPEEEYIAWIGEVFAEITRIGKTVTIYTPHKWHWEYWQILGKKFRQIILPFKPAGAIRFGFSNQFNFLLTNAKPEKPIPNVWHDLQQPGLGFFYREETYGHEGKTSEEITWNVVEKLCTADTIYDPFMGTGTTAVAAARAGKNYIGSEINEVDVALARKRLQNNWEQLQCV